MKIQSLPKDLLVELLRYLADYEKLEGLSEILEVEFSMEDVRAAFRELSVQLDKELETERQESVGAVARDYLSKEARNLLSSLSPSEERKLLRAFGFLDH